MIDEKLVHYMNIIDHLNIAKDYLNKTDSCWIGDEIHVIIEKVKQRAGSQAYDAIRKEWIDSARVGG